MKTILPQSVNSVQDAKQVVSYLFEILGGGFHPDTPISDYINTGTILPTFTEPEISRLQPLLEQCFDVMGESIYDYSWELYIASQPAGTFDNN